MVWKKLLESDVRLMDNGDRAIGIQRKQRSKKNMEGVDEEDTDEEEEEEIAGTDEALLQQRAIREAARAPVRKLKEARKKVGEGKRLPPSWIWRHGGTGELVDNKVLEEGIQVEWCKAYSRAKRWEEEVVLLKEEMRRCLVTLEYMAQQWEGCKEYVGPLADGKPSWKENWTLTRDYSGPLERGSDDLHREGVYAYAEQQAELFRSLQTKFEAMWTGVSEEEGIEVGASSKAHQTLLEGDETEEEEADEEVLKDADMIAEEEAKDDFD
ncbi:hypothetical protein VKT23_011943 [Stygiomarasmius scandens]|uniref:Uncharacterized protein n=1 Tax=Marasmiellus scandens TaxID=2682957 RepID=A0ABR1J7E1_9AGAR